MQLNLLTFSRLQKNSYGHSYRETTSLCSWSLQISCSLFLANNLVKLGPTIRGKRRLRCPHLAKSGRGMNIPFPCPGHYRGTRGTPHTPLEARTPAWVYLDRASIFRTFGIWGNYGGVLLCRERKIGASDLVQKKAELKLLRLFPLRSQLDDLSSKSIQKFLFRYHTDGV